VIECIVDEVEPEEVSEVCKDNDTPITEANIKVGTKVKLISDRAAFERAFLSVGYVWDNAMEKILGEVVEVVDRPQTGIFGLPKSNPSSWQQIWWYPFTVIECIVEDEPEEVCADNAPDITEANVKVGTKVRLISDKDAFRKAFNAVGYVWDNAMEKILGEVVEVVDRPQTGIFGLPKSDPNSW
jgi:predicted RecA/RadA family phage recombinase